MHKVTVSRMRERYAQTVLSSRITYVVSHVRIKVWEEILASICMADCYPKYFCIGFIRIFGTSLSNFALSHKKFGLVGSEFQVMVLFFKYQN